MCVSPYRVLGRVIVALRMAFVIPKRASGHVTRVTEVKNEEKESLVRY